MFISSNFWKQQRIDRTVKSSKFETAGTKVVRFGVRRASSARYPVLHIHKSVRLKIPGCRVDHAVDMFNLFAAVKLTVDRTKDCCYIIYDVCPDCPTPNFSQVKPLSASFFWHSFYFTTFPEKTIMNRGKFKIILCFIHYFLEYFWKYSGKVKETDRKIYVVCKR